MQAEALYAVAQIRVIEHKASAALPEGVLMQRAGKAVADSAQRLLSSCRSALPILVAAGPGNNGGDAMEAASLLRQSGFSVRVVLLAEPNALPVDARAAYSRAQISGVEFISLQSTIDSDNWRLVIDGLFGIGLARPLQGPYRALASKINSFDCPVLAIDIPSGLDANTGCVVGPDGMAVIATRTASFIANKPGLYTGHGRDYAGVVDHSDLDIDPALFGEPLACLNHPRLFASALQKRNHASHKGSFGDLVVLGGADGMAGAAILAARMGAKAGAGRVFAGFAGTPLAYDSLQPELMCRAADSIVLSQQTIVAGPGLGMSRAAHDLLAKVLSTQQSLVLDADALNLIAAEAPLSLRLMQRTGPCLMTPHPLEAARLLSKSSEAVQADRLHAATNLAQRWQAVTILKGSGTIIAHPDGRLVINATGNPGLATAGSGDVLAGLCGALLAQHWPLWEASLAAVWLHGKAADQLAEAGIGPAGMLASELIDAIRSALNTLIVNAPKC